MSVRDQVPVAVIEQRLRDAFAVAGETVRADAIRGLPGPATVPGRARDLEQAKAPARRRAERRPRRLYEQALVPLAAAAAVALIATTMTVVVPKLLDAKAGAAPGGHPARTGGDAPVRAAGPGFAAMPRFFVGLRQAGPAQDARTLDVYSSLTGRVVASLRPPPELGPGNYFQAVAALGNDRTFVAAAASVDGSRGACHTGFWRFTLTAKGQPTGLRRLLPQMPGEINYNSSLAVSADGRVLAYAANDCTPKFAGQVVVIHLATAAARTWTTVFPGLPRNLSLSADGALLGFTGNPSGGFPGYTPAADSAWVLRTDSRPGPLASRYRKALHVLNGVPAAVLSHTGATLFAVTPDGRAHQEVGAYVTATGRPIRLLHVLPLPYVNPNGLTADVSGDHAIVYMLQLAHIQELNLVTGQLRTVPVNPKDSPLGVAW